MPKTPVMNNYSINRQELASITDLEQAFGTVRLLPENENIPKEFWDGNVYTRIATALFYGMAMPAGEVTFNQGFEGAQDDMVKCVRAHLTSFEPKHERKIAGVGYMISKICTVTPS